MQQPDLRSLNFRDKISLLKQEGIHLTTRTNNYYYIKLYSLGGYYVEVWTSSHLPWEGVVKVKVLSNTRMLKPYLPKDLFDRAIAK